MKLLMLLVLWMAVPIQEDGARVQPVLVTNDGAESPVEIASIDELSVNLTRNGKSESASSELISQIRFADQLADQLADRTKESAEANSDTAVSRIQLVDGSVVVADKILIDAEATVEFSETTDGNRQSIGTRNVDTILFSSLSDGSSGQWQQLLESGARTTDWLIFERDGAMDYIEGQAGTVTSDLVTFATAGQTAEAPRSRISGIAYYHAAGRNFVEPVALLTTTAGSQLFIRSARRSGTLESRQNVEAPQNDELATYVVQTVCGAEFSLAENEISTVDFGAVRFRYLSDLVPSTIEWNPLVFNEDIYEYQARLNGPRFNESFAQSALSLEFVHQNRRGGEDVELRTYSNGIAMKGGSRMVFPLGGQYSTLQGVCGFSPDAPLDGLVELVLTGDGNDLYRRVLDNRRDEVQHLDININAVERLTIHVKYHDGRNVGDVIHFCELRVNR